MSRTAAAAVWPRLRPDTGWGATAWYSVLTLVMTWPLVTGLTGNVPSDHGDPLLNAWILAWNFDHFLRALSGDVAALAAIWHANIFHPAPYTLAYSEYLFTQSVLALPIYALSGNILLTYNLLFLGAFVLAGTGMYLFVRAITGDWRAAFLSGLLFAFAPYRLDQAPHLQVMWSGWMPLVLLGLRRFFDRTGMPGPAAPGVGPAAGARRGSGLRHPGWYLGGAVLALLAQNLSCGYYLLFFPPFVALYALLELTARGRLGDWRAWAALATAGAASLALTLPFMWPYLQLRDLGQHARSAQEIASFSADTFAYLTAHPTHRAWSWLDSFPRAEGHLFPGLLPIVLALVGVTAAVAAAVRAAGPGRGPAGAGTDRPRPAPGGRARALLARTMFAATVISGVLLVGLFLGLEGKYAIGGISISLFSALRPFAYMVLGAGLTLALSARARAAAADLVRRPVVWAAALAALAAWLSLGPLPAVLGDPLRDATIYPLIYAHVPGFDGLRVPARFAMIVVLGLAWASAAGYTVLARRLGPRVFAPLCVLVLADAAAFPIPLDGRATSDRLLAPPATVPVTPPPLARAIDALPADAVVLELPFGDISWEIRYVYASTFHWRRLVNGYSGHFPPHYLALRAALAELPESEHPRAWPMLAASGATHLVVHGDALGPDRTARLRAWIERHGARLVRSVGDGHIYAR